MLCAGSLLICVLHVTLVEISAQILSDCDVATSSCTSLCALYDRTLGAIHPYNGMLLSSSTLAFDFYASRFDFIYLVPGSVVLIFESIANRTIPLIALGYEMWGGKQESLGSYSQGCIDSMPCI